eukprot:NODE_84_length_22354_cov_0.646506.p23 type:complete len:106 gc:universal NODE_84_length_22354_cov_0.646506:17175-16858(-)
MKENKFAVSSNVRGGRDQFKWDNVEYAEREHYLGVSSRQTTTRRGKDLLWYSKEKQDKLDKKKKKKQKKLETELMNAELGISKKVRLDKKKFDSQEYTGLGASKE